MNHTEEVKGKHYQAMPEVDMRTVRVETLEPGTMREIIVQANLGHEGAVLISPVRDLDSRHICPRAISIMTKRPLQVEEKGPMTAKQRHKIEKGRRVATYAVYNTSQETIVLPKNQIMGCCQLILQLSEGEYLQEMAAMRQEGEAKQKLKKGSESEEVTKQNDEEEL